MYPQKYFTLNFIINEIFSVEQFHNYNILHCEGCEFPMSVSVQPVTSQWPTVFNESNCNYITNLK